MKKTLLFVLLIVASSAAVHAQVEHEATNCTFTGNSSDYCNASDGTNNLKVINCTPGTTDCFYDN
jgi:hypothetical protein